MYKMATFNNWQEVISSLGDVENHFFTKEDSELVESYISLRSFNFQDKVKDFIETLPVCKIYEILKIRKIGPSLIADKKNRLDAIIQSQTNYVDWCKAQVQGLTTISANFNVTPTVDVKQAVISLILQTQIITQITRLGTQTTLLEEELGKPTFCVDCCEVQ
jgi:hypothetical protein